ncbi:hypothetical protein [Eilatimonas milleporae]|uniref:Tetratricopeptide repeat protein n=1 Tax=Eilatimonas milleporae TaxID=911205 RepID=A0A3M0BV45_9PROT|nr:hypothetical protein [Eilatimonas milleporae]RMB01444.1 hypothetical protein BXY39_3628 [Eilatimonas milleporae]
MKKTIITLALAALTGACSTAYGQSGAMVEAEAPANEKMTAHATHGHVTEGVKATGYTELLAGNLSDAEATLSQGGPEALSVFDRLNLAYIYSRTGRAKQAEALYESILSMSDNPYALLGSGKTKRVKTIARDAMVALSVKDN